MNTMKNMKIFSVVVMMTLLTVPSLFAQGDKEERGGSERDSYQREHDEQDGWSQIALTSSIQLSDNEDAASDPEVQPYLDQILPLDEMRTLAGKSAGTTVGADALQLEVMNGYLVYSLDNGDGSVLLFDAADGSALKTVQDNEMSRESEKADSADITATIFIDQKQDTGDGGELSAYQDQILSIGKSIALLEDSLSTPLQVSSMELQVINSNVVYTAVLSDNNVAVLDAGNGTILYMGPSLDHQGDNQGAEGEGLEEDNADEQA